MLECKAAKHGRYFGKIGRFEPTSQVCSACGAKDGPKPRRSVSGPARSVGPPRPRRERSTQHPGRLTSAPVKRLAERR
ncbi:zinc ribbon domain-containing protein [Streptomyces lavendulocolor]|uniref:zinc ribbon domain-containing protein n=1 Tax=Streptomyces lavendulocolor TaxID=67316 RepID=UPI003F4D1F26